MQAEVGLIEIGEQVMGPVLEDKKAECLGRTEKIIISKSVGIKRQSARNLAE